MSARKSKLVIDIELADRVREKLSSGNYRSENELIAAGLDALEQRDVDIDNWVRGEVVPAYDAWKADPSRAIPIDDAFARLDARIAAEQSKTG